MKEMIMNKPIFVLFLSIFYLTGCATPNKHLLKINTTPSDALVAVHKTSDVSSAHFRQIAGTTPLKKNFDFGKNSQLWLEIEKRGYAPHIEKVFPETGQVSIDLEKIKDKNGEYISEYTFPKINRILLAKPDIKIFERGFSSETISEEKSILAQEEFAKGIKKFFSKKYEVVAVESSNLDKKLLRTLWRDVQPAMELLDPVRLKYVAPPPLLETKSSRKAAYELGNKYGTEVMLFIKGKQNIETAGFKAGLIGASIAGTALSYTGARNRALENNHSFFVYNIYTPSFGEGTLLGNAILVDCSNGEILWVNRGFFEKILTDLFITINHN
jgi:hypothetical protein